MIDFSKDYFHGKRGISDLRLRIIFATKGCKKILKKSHRLIIRKMIREKQQKFKYTLNELVVKSNYVSMDIQLDPYYSIDNVITSLKFNISGYLRKNYGLDFFKYGNLITIWTRDYYVKSIGVEEDIKKLIPAYLESQINVVANKHSYVKRKLR